MSDTINGEEQNETEDLNSFSKSALARHLEQRGLEFERLQLSLSNMRDAGFFVYKAELRSPNEKSTEWLCILKGVGPDGPKIAFNSGGTFFTALLGAGRRLRGGLLEWHEDSYPPDDIEERLAYMHENQTWILY